MRVLVTGLGTFWGSRLAQQLEQRDDVEIVVGLDTTEPRLPLVWSSAPDSGSLRSCTHWLDIYWFYAISSAHLSEGSPHGHYLPAQL